MYMSMISVGQMACMAAETNLDLLNPGNEVWWAMGEMR